MSATQTIPTTPLEHPSMDYAALRAEGIRLLERLAGHRWTDFNRHDPGITILEQLCYAITELGYRIAHDMPDLLAGGEDPYRSLHGPATILTTEPVTLLDLRKLCVDVEGVRNAWIEPIRAPGPALLYHEGEEELRLSLPGAAATADRYQSPVALVGLYRVLLATSDLADIDGAAVRREVIRRLHAHRPLCADFPEVLALEPEDVQLRARVEIAPAADAAAVLAAIYHKVSAHIAPSVRFRTLDERLAAGAPMDEIFTGPRLQRGFIDEGELAGLTQRSALHTSDLLREIMDVPGVRACHDISLSSARSGEGELEPWTLALDPDRAPRFDYHRSAVTPVRDGIEVAVDRASVADAYLARLRSAATARPLSAAEQDRRPPVGRDRRLSRYTSIQRELPPCYGVGVTGLPASAPPERRAQARQLKAYLLFFDQLLCNSFAQLGLAKDLLSFHGEATATYAAQAVEDEELGFDHLRRRDRDAHAAWLRAIAADPPRSRSSSERAHRFLDHLMARVAEQLPGGSPSAPDTGTAGKDLADREARDKRALLQRYPRVSSARGTAFDYTRPGGGENRSGLEERIQLLLGLDPAREETFLLIEHILLRPVPEDRRQIGADDSRPVPLLSASGSRDPYSLQLSFVFPAWPARLESPAFRRLVEQTIRAETPAHLTPYVRWLQEDAWLSLKAAYDAWAAWHRRYWTENFGL